MLANARWTERLFYYFCELFTGTQPKHFFAAIERSSLHQTGVLDSVSHHRCHVRHHSSAKRPRVRGAASSAVIRLSMPSAWFLPHRIYSEPEAQWACPEPGCEGDRTKGEVRKHRLRHLLHMPLHCMGMGTAYWMRLLWSK